jgi:hypothetical protein
MIGRSPPSFARRFWPLVALGCAGVASLPLAMLPALRILVRNGYAPGMSLGVLAALSLIQPALLVIAGAAVGAAVAPGLGLTSHAARVNVHAGFAKELPLAIVSGVAIAIVIVVLDFALFQHAALQRPASARAIAGGLVGGVLYGGLAEEIMMRWGLMSLVAWVGVRLFARNASTAPGSILVAAIVIVALLFAAGHLPAAAMTAPLTSGVVARTLLLNAVAGLLFGWLFWRRSLESAMVAHASVHVVFAVAQTLGWR